MANNDTKKTYEVIVKYNKPKFDTKLTITEKTIELEKEKGIFKKTYKVIESISIDNIKVIKDKVQVNNKNSEVIIETINKTLKVVCNNLIEAKKLTEEIIKVKTGENLLERTSSKVVKISNVAKSTIKTIGTAVISVGTVAIAIIENKEKIGRTFETVKDLFKKH